MKFINHSSLETEMKIAEIQGEVRETNGLTWAYISFGLIIVTFIAIIMSALILPNNLLQKLNQNSNTPGTSVQQK